MLKRLFVENRLLKLLLKNSFFSHTQLDTLLIMRNSSENLLFNKINLCDRGKVSKGSFYRTLKQAERNQKRALYTIMLSSYLNFIHNEGILGLVKINNIINETSDEQINEEQANVLLKKISDVIEAITKTGK